MSRSSRRIPQSGALLAVLVAVALSLVASTAAAAATLPTVSIAVTKTTGAISGSLESGAVNVVTTDTGFKEATVLLVRLGAGVSFAEAEAFAKTGIKGDPNNVDSIGSIVFDIEANPGTPNETQMELKAGSYLLLVGGGKGEPAIRQTFTVTAGAAPVAMPAAQAKVRSIDFGFKGPSKLHDGETVAFENEGFLVHMDLAFPVKNMKAAKQVVAHLESGKEKGLEKFIVGPPVLFAGPLSHGATEQETITAKPGVYVQVCFMETQDHRVHTRLGMERIITITK
ncbi:MAG TPA: hypothetical protein VGG08_09985 [Solirubrobacteraceae bacterium]|jgi:hypothetical protein